MFVIPLFAVVAQLVEQRIRNAQVVGSNPTSSSIRWFLAEKCARKLERIFAFISFYFLQYVVIDEI